MSTAARASGVVQFDDHATLAHLRHRILQEDGLSVFWWDTAGRQAALWNLAKRAVALPGCVGDVTTGRVLPRAAQYELGANHTYMIEWQPLRKRVGI